MDEHNGWRAIKSTARTIFGSFVFFLLLLKVHALNMPLYISGHVPKCKIYHYCSRNISTKVLQFIPIFIDIRSPLTISPQLCYLWSATFSYLLVVVYSIVFCCCASFCYVKVNGLTSVPRLCEVPVPFHTLQQYLLSYRKQPEYHACIRVLSD